VTSVFAQQTPAADDQPVEQAAQVQQPSTNLINGIDDLLPEEGEQPTLDRM
jgi:hypothetical protein